MKYPQIPKIKHRNRKLTDEQIQYIQTSGKSAWQLAKEMGITYATARRYLDPEFRQKISDYTGKIIKEKYRLDKKFKQHSNDTRAKNQKLNRVLYPEMGEYNRFNSTRQRKRVVSAR